MGAAVNNYQLFLAREEDAKQMAEPNNECRTDNPKVIEGTGGRPRTEISPRSNLIASAPNEEGGEGDEASSSAVSSASTAAVALSSRGQRRGGGGATPFNVEGYKENRKQRHQEQPD